MHSDESSTRPELQELLAICLDAFDRSGSAKVERILAAHPELADQVREHLVTLSEAGLLESETPTELPDRLGEFRLLERLGEGGMGVVFRAQQDSLKREVAVKLIRPERLYFDGACERFQREVEVVARLNHPNVVPVYSVGGADELPYFAMELIQGPSWAEVLAGLRTRRPEELDERALTKALAAKGTPIEPERAAPWVELVLRSMRQVAAALEHAHERGVLHRDVKPSNVMITSGGRTLLADFGLASSQAGSSITRTGSMIGSLPYMPPEHLRGEPLDERSDVYSLAVTLYELLALTPAYGDERVEALRTKILDGNHRRLRDLNPAVSWDVETVCAKAMEPSPEHRYASARDLARDLDNLLALRPIEARRTNPALRMRRWIQREPARAVALLLGVLIIVIGPLTWALVQRSANLQIEASLQRADAGLDLAIESVDAMLGRFGDADVADLPVLLSLRLDLVQRARELLIQLRGLRSTQDLDSRIAELDLTVSRILSKLGRPGEALPWAERFLDDQRSHNESATRAADLKRGWHHKAVLLGSLGQLDEGLEALTRALEHWKACADPNAASTWVETSKLEHTRSTYHYRLGDTRGARTAAQASLVAARRVDPEHPEALRALGSSLSWLAKLMVDAEDPGAAALFADSRPAFEEARSRAPQDPAVLLECIQFLNVYADHQSQIGQPDASAATLERALSIAQELVRLHPDTAVHRMWVGQIHLNQAILTYSLERYEEARDFAQASVEVLAALHADEPQVQRHAIQLSQALIRLALSYTASGQIEDAARRIERAIEVARSAHARAPDADSNECLAMALVSRADLQRRSADYRACSATLREAAEHPNHQTETLRLAADLWVHCANLVADDFDLERTERLRLKQVYLVEALAAFRNAFERGSPSVADIRSSPWLTPLLERQDFRDLLDEFTDAQ